jgi:hypothetical protein
MGTIRPGIKPVVPPLKAVFILRRELAEFRWFICRHCNGIFFVGKTIDYSAEFEARAAHAHEKKCGKP